MRATAAPKLPALFHVGIVVADLATAAGDFDARHGLRDERTMDLTVTDALMYGERTTFSARYTFLPLGNTDLELIQPLEGDSPYTRFLAENGGDGIHHIAFIVDSIDEHLEHVRAQTPDCSLILDAKVPGGLRFVYVEGTAHGAVLELVEVPEGFDLDAGPN